MRLCGCEVIKFLSKAMSCVLKCFHKTSPMGMLSDHNRITVFVPSYPNPLRSHVRRSTISSRRKSSAAKAKGWKAS